MELPITYTNQFLITSQDLINFKNYDKVYILCNTLDNNNMPILFKTTYGDNDINDIKQLYTIIEMDMKYVLPLREFYDTTNKYMEITQGFINTIYNNLIPNLPNMTQNFSDENKVLLLFCPEININNMKENIDLCENKLISMRQNELLEQLDIITNQEKEIDDKKHSLSDDKIKVLIELLNKNIWNDPNFSETMFTNIFLKNKTKGITAKKGDFYTNASTQHLSKKIVIRDNNIFLNFDQNNKLTQYLTDALNNNTSNLDLIKNVLSSEKYCSVLLNNMSFLKKYKQYLIDNPNEMKKAWCMLYYAENLKLKYNLFDLETVRNLPSYEYTFNKTKESPYIPLLIDAGYYPTFIGNNIIHQTVPPVVNLRTDPRFYGVCNLDEFKIRLNVFMTNKSITNLFNNIDFTNIAITGSVIAGALPKYNVNMFPDCIYNPTNDTYYPRNYVPYFDKKYANADLDIMINHKSIEEYSNEVVKIKKQIESNTSSAITITMVRTSTITITREYLESLLDDKEMADYKVYIDKKLVELPNNIKRIVYNNVYLKNKIIVNNNIKLDAMFNSYYTPCTIDDLRICDTNKDITRNDMSNEYVYEDYNGKIGMLLRDGMRIKFNSNTAIKRAIELFKVDSFLGCVQRFHLPCVRGYYTGDNIYMLPSCISAMMTNICLDHNLMYNKYNPYTIFTKYINRGYVILMNPNNKAEYEIYKKQNNIVCNYNDVKTLTYNNNSLNECYVNFHVK